MEVSWHVDIAIDTILSTVNPELKSLPHDWALEVCDFKNSKKKLQERFFSDLILFLDQILPAIDRGNDIPLKRLHSLVKQGMPKLGRHLEKYFSSGEEWGNQVFPHDYYTHPVYRNLEYLFKSKNLNVVDLSDRSLSVTIKFDWVVVSILRALNVLELHSNVSDYINQEKQQNYYSYSPFVLYGLILDWSSDNV